MQEEQKAEYFIKLLEESRGLPILLINPNNFEECKLSNLHKECTKLGFDLVPFEKSILSISERIPKDYFVLQPRIEKKT